MDSLKKGMTPDEIRAYKTISEADRIKINNWINTPSDELYIKYKDVFDNPKYYNQETGEIYWPGQNGDINKDGFLNGKYENTES